MAHSMWSWLVAKAGAEVTLFVSRRKRQPDQPLDLVEVRMRAGVLQACPALETSVTRNHVAWPSVGGSATLVFREWPPCDIWLVTEIVSAIAQAVEVKLQVEHAEAGEGGMEIVSGNWFVDPDLREALAQLGRNPYATHRLTKKLGLRTGLHASLVDVKAQLRYWLASKRVFQSCTTVATTMDATRFSKKDW
eukprot:6473511-Amphidinium_carterae.1